MVHIPSADFLILFELNTHATSIIQARNMGVFQYIVYMLLKRNVFIPDDVYQRALINAFNKNNKNNDYNIILLEKLKPHIFRQRAIEYSILGNDIRNYNYFCKAYGENPTDAFMFLTMLYRLNIINFGSNPTRVRNTHITVKKNTTGLRRVNSKLLHIKRL